MTEEFIERARRELSVEEVAGLRVYEASTDRGVVIFMPIIKGMGRQVQWIARGSRQRCHRPSSRYQSQPEGHRCTGCLGRTVPRLLGCSTAGVSGTDCGIPRAQSVDSW